MELKCQIDSPDFFQGNVPRCHKRLNSDINFTVKNMEIHVMGFFMKNIVFNIYLGMVGYSYAV